MLPAAAEGLQITRIHREPLVFVASASHPLARRRSVRMRDLDGVAYVHLARAYEPVYHDHIQGLARQAKINLRGVADSAHLYDNLSLVAAGVGVSILPDCVRQIRRAGLVTRPLLPAGMVLETGVAHRKNELSKVPLAFVDIVRRVRRTR
jgi:DNA-binding transcriptional LysR family regulator